MNSDLSLDCESAGLNEKTLVLGSDDPVSNSSRLLNVLIAKRGETRLSFPLEPEVVVRSVVITLRTLLSA